MTPADLERVRGELNNAARVKHWPHVELPPSVGWFTRCLVNRRDWNQFCNLATDSGIAHIVAVLAAQDEAGGTWQ